MGAGRSREAWQRFQRGLESNKEEERIFIELMTSDQGVQRGLEMKDLRDLKDFDDGR